MSEFKPGTALSEEQIKELRSEQRRMEDQFYQELYPRFFSILTERAVGRNFTTELIDELASYWASTIAISKAVKIELGRFGMKGSADGHAWHRKIDKEYKEATNTDLIKFLQECIQQEGGASMLDVGSGTNFVLIQASEEIGEGFHGTGITVEDNVSDSNVETIFGPAEIIPANLYGKYDLITCINSTTYFLHPKLVLEESAKCLKDTQSKMFFGVSPEPSVTMGQRLFIAQHPEIEKFSYTVPDIHFLAGKTYSGLEAYRIKNFVEMLQYVEKIIQGGGEFVIDERKYRMKEVPDSGSELDQFFILVQLVE